MSRVEFLAWAEFYEAHPFDDLHRYHRPAALVAASMGGYKFDQAVDILAPKLPEVIAPTPGFVYSAADLATFKAFGRKPPKLIPRAES